MNALYRATSRVLSNKCSDRYTPRLHGRPSTILISSHSEPVVSSLPGDFLPAWVDLQLCRSDLSQDVPFHTSSKKDTKKMILDGVAAKGAATPGMTRVGSQSRLMSFSETGVFSRMILTG